MHQQYDPVKQQPYSPQTYPNQIPISNDNSYNYGANQPPPYMANINLPPPMPMQNNPPPPIQQGYAVGQTVNWQPPPQQQQMIVPGQVAFGTVFMPKSGFDKLMVPGIFVKQKFELLEVLTGCETQNKYTVYACDVAGNKEGAPLFKCKEKSGCCNRNFLPGDCRQFNMDITHDSGGILQFDGLPFLFMQRPFACTCFCLNRPYIEINYSENGKNVYLGKVTHDFSCCEMYFSLFDKTNTCVYQIRGTIWQIGVYNRQQNNCACCKSCQQAFLFIHDLRQGMKRVGIIEKRGRGFSELISDADNFSVLFPIKANAEERTLIMAACLLLDFRYFETKGGMQGNHHNNWNF